MKNKIQTMFILACAVFGLSACENSNQKINTENEYNNHDTLKNILITDNTSRNDSIIYDDSFFPNDSLYSAKVLTIGTFHDDEVWENADKEKWFGLFKNNTDYYIAETKIETKRIHDGIVDQDVLEKTGWEVKTVNKDTCLILVESLSFLTNRDIQNVRITKNYIYPDDTIKFRYLEVDYKIFATGGKKKVQNEPEWFDVWNYKLYITATINGQEHKSLLVAQANFDDQMINLIFAGDIDGDGILDLIIDTSRHYNSTNPTIYLSRPADSKEVVKPIGDHTSVGC